MITPGPRGLAAAGTGPMRLRRALDRRTAALRGSLTPSGGADGLRSRFAPALISGELTPLLSKSLADYLASPPETSAPLPQTMRMLPIEPRAAGDGEATAIEPAAASNRPVAPASSPTGADVSRRVLPDWLREAAERRTVPAAAARPAAPRALTAMTESPSRHAELDPVSVGGEARRQVQGGGLLTMKLTTYFAAPPPRAQSEHAPAQPAGTLLQPSVPAAAETERRVPAEPWPLAAGPLGARRALADFMSGLDSRPARNLPDTPVPAEEAARFGVRRLQPLPVVEADLSERLADILREQAQRQGIDLT
jgi:hypothetical protein